MPTQPPVNALQAAQLVGVSERTMRTWLAAGKVAGARKVTPPREPACWEIPVEALQALRRIHAVPTPATVIPVATPAPATAARVSTLPTVPAPATTDRTTPRRASEPDAGASPAAREVGQLLRIVERIGERVEQLAGECAALRERVQLVEQDVVALRARAPAREPALVSASPATPALAARPLAPTVPRPREQLVESLPQDGRTSEAASAGDGEAFANRSQAARFLMRHGINSLTTPLNWTDWHTVELTARAVLELALSLPPDHRRTWRLVRCGVPACLCVELLPARP